MILQRHNFRFRHPIPEEQINDAFCEIYYVLTYLNGVENSKYKTNGILYNKYIQINVPEYKLEQNLVSIELNKINNIIYASRCIYRMPKPGGSDDLSK